jgi:hypothetical protein
MEGRVNWSEEPVCRFFQPQKPLVFYDHTEAVGKTSPLVPDIFPIPFPAKVPGRKKGPTPKRLIKKGTGYAWREKNKRFKNRINQLLKDEWLPSKYRLEKKSEFV